MFKRFFWSASIFCLLCFYFTVPLYAVVDESTLSPRQVRYVPHELVVRYKSGQNPDDLSRKAEKRSERGKTFLGLLQNVGENLVTRLKRQETPEEAIEGLRGLEARNKIVDKEYLFASWVENKVLGTTSEEKTFPFDDYFLLKTSPSVDTLDAAQEFQKDPRVSFASPNYLLNLLATPDDPYWDEMWGLKKIEMEEAWEINQGSSEVTVAVLDSGVGYNHEDFQNGNVEIVKGPNLWPGGCGLPSNDPMDQHGHGTHVAGTIGAATNNKQGIPGINWKIKLLAIKVGCTGTSISVSGALQGLVYAADNGADVINMSFGGWDRYEPDQGIDPCNVYNEALEYARNKGVVLVAAAGNEGGNISGDSCLDQYGNLIPHCRTVPAACEAVTLTVGATDQNDRRSIWSSTGSSNYDTAGGVDVAAPGTDIYSLRLTGGYVAWGGTSMAAPHVSGLAALVLAQNPGFSPAEVRARIVDYADAIGTDQPIGPRINAYRSLSAGGQTTPTATPTPMPTPTGGPTAPPTGGPTATPSPGAVTRLDLTVKLQGIDSQKRNRGMAVTVDSHQYSPVFNGSEGGHFKGTVENPGIGSGNYTLAVKELHHLTKEFSAALFAGANDIVRVSAGDELRAGDIDSDNDVDGDDKAALLNAYSPFSVIDPAVVFGDLNEDGYVNSLDYSLLLTNLGGLPTPTPTVSPTPSPTGSGSPSPTATPTPPPDWKYWSGTVTVNDPDELEPYIFVGVCEVDSEGEDCSYARDNGSEWYVYRKPEDDGTYQFGGLEDHWYKTFALATGCRESDTETGNPKFPYRPCSFDPDDYYDTDGPTWVSPPESGVNFSLEIAEDLPPPPQTSYDIPVLSIKYFPDENGDGRLDQEETGMSDEIEVIRERVATFTEETVVALEEGSTYHGYKDTDASPSLRYEIVEEKEFLKPVPTEAGTGARPADHVEILTGEGFDICDYVENDGVKEVWIWMYHTDDVYTVESYQRGPYGGVGNGFMNLPLCGKTYTVYDYNYGAGTGFNVEDHTHHLEAVFRWIDSGMFDGKFVGLPGEHEYYRCGWTHCPPNTIEFCVLDHEYDWCNERTVLSDCEDWMPDGSGEKKEVSCHTWESGCNPNNCRGLFRIWWMQNIPGLNNNVYDGSKKLRNWWDFVGDFDRAMERGKNFY